MISVDEASEALDAATSALARLDAELKRAQSDEDGARECEYPFGEPRSARRGHRVVISRGRRA